jgi:hypothetical protein
MKAATPSHAPLPWRVGLSHEFMSDVLGSATIFTSKATGSQAVQTSKMYYSKTRGRVLGFETPISFWNSNAYKLIYPLILHLIIEHKSRSINRITTTL